MKIKNQPHLTIELEAKERLIVYVYEYLVHSGAKQAADTFKESIGYNKEIQVNESPGFLSDWWCVFWDLYRATHDRRNMQPESSSEARAFHDFTRRTPMSPSMIQTSPLQQAPPPPPPQYMAGGPPRYGPPHHGLRGPPPPRMQGQPQHGPPPGSFVPAASPRYAQHQGPPPHLQQQQPHMSQAAGPMGFGPLPPNQMGSSPGAMNRMTPVGGPQQMIGPPGMPNGPPPPPQPLPQQQQQQQQQQQGPPQMIGMPPGQAPSPVGSIQPGPPRNGSQGSVGGWPGGQMGYGNVSSPAQQSMYSSGPGSNQASSQGAGGGGGGGSSSMMMADTSLMDVKNSPIITGDPSTPHSEEYVMPVPFGQETSDQCESDEIMKLKQSMQEDTTKMFEKEQSEFNLDYSDSQNKWS